MHSLGLRFQSLMLRIWLRLRCRHWNSYGSQDAPFDTTRHSGERKGKLVNAKNVAALKMKEKQGKEKEKGKRGKILLLFPLSHLILSTSPSTFEVEGEASPSTSEVEGEEKWGEETECI